MSDEERWSARARRIGADLLWALEQVTLEEFRTQDRRFDRDTRFGRELLYLSSNTEWVRSTVETVSIEDSQSVDTTLDVHVDLDEVTHEAFWDKDRFWLPVLSIPSAPETAGGDIASPDITVRDGAGGLRSVLPQAVVLRQVAAALTEIVLTMAANRWASVQIRRGGADPADPAARAAAGREDLLVLSAAMLRVVRGENCPEDQVDAVRHRAATLRPEPGEGLEGSRAAVALLLSHFLGTLGAPELTARWQVHEHALLTRRTAQILLAFIDSQIVVVGVDRQERSAVLSVHLPGRALERDPAPEGTGWWTGGRRWWHRHRPHRHASLTIDLLAPTSQSPRDLKLVLGPGLSSRTGEGDHAADFGARIAVGEAEVVSQLRDVVRSLVAQPPPPPGVRSALAELAAAKVPAVRELYRYHSPDDETPGTAVPEDLARLAADLREVSDGADQGRAEAALRTAWPTIEERLRRPMRRSTSDASLSPRVMLIHSEAVEQAGLQAPPTRAEAHVRLVVTDSPLLSAARYSSLMSLLVTLVVGGVVALTGQNPDPQVLAGALTIFSAILATRVESPDRTTLRGVLSVPGYLLVVLSVLPPIVLAVILGFTDRDPDALSLLLVGSLVVTLAAQVLLFVAMDRTVLSGEMAPGAVGLRLRTSPSPELERADSLNASWWRATTAEALRLGRPAHAYVTWKSSPQAGRWWTALRPTSKVQERQEEANLLSLMEAGTTRQSLTFQVFRDQPEQQWIRDNRARAVRLDPDRLVPGDFPSDLLTVYVGLHEDAQDPPRPLGSHPVVAVVDLVARHGFGVADVQLPVPGPDLTDGDRLWAQVQIAVPVGFTDRVRTLLEAVAAKGDGDDVELLVRLGPRHRSHRLAGPPPVPEPAAPVTKATAVRAQDLDVLRRHLVPRDQRSYVVLAVTAAARPGIECEILQAVSREASGPGAPITLSGLSTAMLHGTAVVFLLGHRADDGGPLGLSEALTDAFRADRLQVLVEERPSAKDLGTPPGPGDGPLLRVQLRSRDRPGLVLQLLAALDRAVGDQAGTTARLDPWYSLLRVVAGGTATAGMTMRLPAELAGVAEWNGEWKEVEQAVRRALADETGPEESVVIGQRWWRNHDATVVDLDVLRYGDAPPTLT